METTKKTAVTLEDELFEKTKRERINWLMEEHGAFEVMDVVTLTNGTERLEVVIIDETKQEFNSIFTHVPFND